MEEGGCERCGAPSDTRGEKNVGLRLHLQLELVAKAHHMAHRPFQFIELLSAHSYRQPDDFIGYKFFCNLGHLIVVIKRVNMPIRSLRFFLLIAIVLTLSAIIFWRLPGLIFREKPFDPKKEEIWSASNILPSSSNLAAMGLQWQARLATLPPEERERSKQRLEEETRYFMQLRHLPEAERNQKARERIEMLMNDPEIQAEWLGDRMRILAGLDPEARSKVIRSYVKTKNNHSNESE